MSLNAILPGLVMGMREVYSWAFSRALSGDLDINEGGLTNTKYVTQHPLLNFRRQTESYASWAKKVEAMTREIDKKSKAKQKKAFREWLDTARQNGANKSGQPEFYEDFSHIREAMKSIRKMLTKPVDIKGLKIYNNSELLQINVIFW